MSSPTSRASLAGGPPDSQDQLVNQIVGSQDTLVTASPSVSYLEVSNVVSDISVFASALHQKERVL